MEVRSRETGCSRAPTKIRCIVTTSMVDQSRQNCLLVIKLPHSPDIQLLTAMSEVLCFCLGRVARSQGCVNMHPHDFPNYAGRRSSALAPPRFHKSPVLEFGCGDPPDRSHVGRELGPSLRYTTMQGAPVAAWRTSKATAWAKVTPRGFTG